MVGTNTFRHVSELLDQAQRAWDGMLFARQQRNSATATLLFNKAWKLRDEAAALDPEHSNPAWRELGQ